MYILTPLHLFGLLVVVLMLGSYTLERLSHWFILVFAGSLALAAVYSLFQGAWPLVGLFGVWSAIAYHRWHRWDAGLDKNPTI